MTKQEFSNLAIEGAFLVISEYRSMEKEPVDWRDTETGKIVHFISLRHNLEVGGVAVKMNERVPEGVSIAELEAPFKKGQMCVLQLSELTRLKGSISCRGKLLPLETAPSPGVSLPVAGGRGPASR